MGWELLGRPKTHKVTKALAKQFAEMEAAPRDRPLSERRLLVYNQLLAAGQFRPVTWASAICKETGDIYRVNGKHTSTMLSGLEKMPDFYVTVEEYECETLEDVAHLYATFDSKMQSRSANDIYQSFAGTIKELNEVSRASVTLAINGLSYAQWGEAVHSHQPAERAELLIDNTNFVLWVDELVHGAADGEKKRRSYDLMKMPVCAAMYGAWSKNRSDATKFWTAVRDETGSKPDLPDRKLAKYLSTVASERQGSRARRAKHAGNREIYVKCLHGWNAWRKGETTNLNYYAEAKIPAVQ